MRIYIDSLFDSDAEGQAGPSGSAGVMMRKMATVAHAPTRRMRRISDEEKASSEGSELGVSGFGEILLRSIVVVVGALSGFSTVEGNPRGSLSEKPTVGDNSVDKPVDNSGDIFPRIICLPPLVKTYPLR